MVFDAIMVMHGWTSVRSKPQDFNLTIEKICDHIAGNARHVGIGSLLAALSPATVDDGWLSLRQAWRPNGNEEHFQPGWAWIRWVTDAYWIDAIFCGGRGANRATWLKCFSRR